MYTRSQVVEETVERTVREVTTESIFEDPTILAGKTPYDLEIDEVFPSDRWVQRPTKGRSTGIKFETINPRTGKVTGGMVVVRWSNNDVIVDGFHRPRHFMDSNGNGLPYWEITNNNGTPIKLYIGPDGTMYTRAPLLELNKELNKWVETDPGEIYTGPITLNDFNSQAIFGQ